MNDIPNTKTITTKNEGFCGNPWITLHRNHHWLCDFVVQSSVHTSRIDELPIQIDQSRITRSMNYYTGAMIFLSIQIMLLVGLFYVYFDSFRKTKSRFLIGLNMFIIVLFIRSILSVISLHTIATEYIRVIPYVSRTFLDTRF